MTNEVLYKDREGQIKAINVVFKCATSPVRYIQFCIIFITQNELDISMYPVVVKASKV